VIVITVPRKIVDYVLVDMPTPEHSYTFQSTHVEVKNMVEQGWEPFGSPTSLFEWESPEGVKTAKVYQAWVKYEEEEKK